MTGYLFNIYVSVCVCLCVQNCGFYIITCAGKRYTHKHLRRREFCGVVAVVGSLRAEDTTLIV